MTRTLTADRAGHPANGGVGDGSVEGRSPSTPDPLSAWKGEFGRRYIRRNQSTAEAARQAAAVFQRILESAKIRASVGSILEVGANVGINLSGLRRALGPSVTLAAVEPNPSACERLRKRKSLQLAEVIEANAYRIPLPDRSYDLVFTNGVLIHVPPVRLPQALREIARVARRFVLCSEYFSDRPVEVPYHGRTGLLWKRDFGGAYRTHCPQLRLLQYGFLWEEEFSHFDNLNWWVFRKASR